jgi:hypothetical protein
VKNFWTCWTDIRGPRVRQGDANSGPREESRSSWHLRTRKWPSQWAVCFKIFVTLVLVLL